MLNTTDPLDIENIQPTITKDDIVFFGCSFTDNKCNFVESEKMYTSIMAKYYDKKLVNLSRGGHGNYRSFDIFGQLNFVDEGTMIVLQLTELSRIRWYNTKVVDYHLSQSPDKSLVTVYNDQFLIYDLIRQLRIIVSLCRSRKLKLIIWSIARFWDSNLDNSIETYLGKFLEYVFMDNRLNTPTSYRVDTGRDGTSKLGTGHPGPKSNQLIAEKLILHFNNLYS
jgi:hypothetical protein